MRTMLSKARAMALGEPPSKQAAPARVPDALAVEIDANGSPVTIDQASWFICFVPGLQKQWWHRFAHEQHRHVFAIRWVKDDTWLLVEPWWTRLMVNVLSFDEALKFLRWGATGHILEVAESIPGRGSQARGWSNCAVLASFLLGRAYWTWTPHGLYRRLLADPTVRPVELSEFLAKHCRQLAGSNADTLPKPTAHLEHVPLDQALTELGVSIMTAATSPSAISLYKAAISESARFSAAAEAFWQHGPHQALSQICHLLEAAYTRGELQLEDCAMAARQFLAMLRGDLHLQLVFGLRGAPGAKEISSHVASVVAVFLHGAHLNKQGNIAAPAADVSMAMHALAC